MATQVPYSRPRWKTKWDGKMRAQLPSGNGKRWLVVLDGDRSGRIFNVRTNICLPWKLREDGEFVLIGTSLTVPKHCVETVQKLLRRPTHRDLKAAALCEISAETQVVYDLAAQHGQKFDNVKHTRWFIERVEDALIQQCAKFSHLAPHMEG